MGRKNIDLILVTCYFCCISLLCRKSAISVLKYLGEGLKKKKKAIKNLIYNCVNMQHLGIIMGIPLPSVN